MVRAAAAADLGRRFEQEEVPPQFAEAPGGGDARSARADDDDILVHVGSGLGAPDRDEAELCQPDQTAFHGLRRGAGTPSKMSATLSAPRRCRSASRRRAIIEVRRHRLDAKR